MVVELKVLTLYSLLLYIYSGQHRNSVPFANLMATILYMKNPGQFKFVQQCNGLQLHRSRKTVSVMGQVLWAKSRMGGLLGLAAEGGGLPGQNSVMVCSCIGAYNCKC